MGTEWVWREGSGLRRQQSRHTKWSGGRENREVAIDTFDLRTRKCQYLTHEAWLKREKARRCADRAIRKAKDQEEAKRQKERQRASQIAYEKWRRKAMKQKGVLCTMNEAEKKRQRGEAAQAQWRSREWRQDMKIADTFKSSKATGIPQSVAGALLKKLELRSWLHRWRRGVSISKWLRKKKREYRLNAARRKEKMPNRAALAHRQRQLWRQQEWRTIMNVQLRPDKLPSPEEEEDEAEFIRRIIQLEEGWWQPPTPSPPRIPNIDCFDDDIQDEDDHRT